MIYLYLNFFFELLFVLSVLGILHTYGFYPLRMSNLASKFSNNRETYSEGDDWPELHVVMAMYNEASVIFNTLQSIVESDYPKGKLFVHIGSDNSTDGSHEIVESFIEDHPYINLQITEGRSGKIKIINRLIEKIPDDEETVLVLCDANVVWSKSLAQKLARHFKDTHLGVVASTVVDRDGSKGGIAAEEESYVNRENSVKQAEGLLWGRMMGAFGACYAMRRSIYEPVPDHFNVDDFYETMACYEQGFDGIVDPEAVCYESVSEEISEEFRRKRRISKGNFQNLKRFFTYLLPWKCGFGTFYSFWSHKGLRWFGPLLLISIILSGSVLAYQARLIYLLAMCGMSVSFAMALADKIMERLDSRRIRLFKFARYFYVMNWALLLGGIEFCRGVGHSVWEPTKRVPEGVAASGE